MSATRVFLEPIPINTPVNMSTGVVPMRAVLSSWKEIAAYFGKGVRTVQRWECELGLPVRRPRPNEKQIVLAFPDELDAWLRGQGSREQPASQAKNKYREEIIHLQKLIAQTMEETKRLHELTERMMKQSRETAEHRKAS